ncbi:hypothetical protein [Noviherbaspirillum soli]|uniref:hypothetical protein n=1 Tax=Noviherbaspirillum soli TaxID=1064518 RepID=UPI00188DB1E0|nr:hypothetical protein [Noviherbaspirillum soli]
MISHATPSLTATEKKVTLRIHDDEITCRHLEDLVTGAADGDRLRGVRQVADISLYIQPRSDAIVRRIFSRGEIDSERAVVKRALLHAADNLTPERLKRMGSPGRLAVRRLQQRAARPGRHDIKVSHVFGDIRLLASGGRKRSFLHSPAKPVKSSGLLKTGAAGLVANHDEYRIRLHDFCMLAGTVESLSLLLQQQGQNQDSEKVLCCIALFRAVASSFIAEDKTRQCRDRNTLFDDLRASMKGDLPYLFIDRWRMARKNGLINEHSFEWVAAVDWLVNGLQPEKQAQARRARKPKSPRSPVSPSLASLQPEFSPLPLRHASHVPSLQPGRQAATMPIARPSDSPSRLVLLTRNASDRRSVHAPAKSRATQTHKMHSTAARHNDDMSPVVRKTKKMTRLVSKQDTPATAGRQQTLQDMLYLASIGKFVSQTIITVDVMPIAINEEDADA